MFLRRTVAIKVLTLPSLEARRRFVEEARLTARLDHPGVVPVHDVGETPEGKPFFAMKRIRGRSLHEVIHTGDMPLLSERLDVVKRVCEAAAYAHDAGVLHLDLKPDNVMIGDYGEVLVVDWGLATEVSDSGAATRQVAGTPSYMAPEQATAGAALSRRTDVYAMGALLYELLTGQPPIEAGTVSEMLEQARSGDIPHPRAIRPEVPPELDALVQRCMAKAPEQRPSDALFLRDEIRAFQEHRELQTLRYGLWSRVDKWRQRNQALVRGVAAAGTVAAVVMTLSTLLYLVSLNLALVEAERQEQLARLKQAEAELYLGRSLLSARRYPAAQETLTMAKATLHELGRPTEAVELALLQAQASGSVVETHQLDITPTHMESDGEVVLLSGGDGTRSVDLDTWEVSEGPLRGQPTRTNFGLAWWVPHRDRSELIAHDGAWTVELPTGSRVLVSGANVYELDRPVAYRLQQGPDGAVRATAQPVDHGPCLGSVRHIAGPVAVCAEGALNVWTGEDIRRPPTLADPTGSHAFGWWALRAEMVELPSGQTVWSDPGRPQKSTLYPEGVGWLTSEGRVRARRWTGGPLALDLDVSALGEPAALAVAPEGLYALVATPKQLHRVRPLVEVVRSTTGEQEYRPRVVAVSRHSVAFADDATVYRSRGDGEVATWTQVATEDDIRGADWSDDGRLVLALPNRGVRIVEPTSETVDHPIERCCLAAAWRGDELAAVGRNDNVHVLTAAGWSTTQVPELAEGAWDVAPWGTDGWVVSDYDRDDVHAVVLEGSEQRPLRGDDDALAFELAVHDDIVVAATSLGTWRWQGDRRARLTSTYSVGATWTDRGPVVAGAEQQLDVFSPGGQHLHRWELDTVALSLDHNDGLLGVSTTGSILRIPLSAPSD